VVNVGDDGNVAKVFALFYRQVFKMLLNLGHENYFPKETVGFYESTKHYLRPSYRPSQGQSYL